MRSISKILPYSEIFCDGCEESWLVRKGEVGVTFNCVLLFFCFVFLSSDVTSVLAVSDYLSCISVVSQCRIILWNPSELRNSNVESYSGILM